MPRPFHLALPTKDLKATLAFYTARLKCKIGRQDTTWVDFDCYGHQLVFHECSDFELKSAVNPVDSKSVRVPHFGVVLTMDDWHELKNNLIKEKQA
eukprot:SAG22_NODE_10673_length_521_cov_1.319905_1_plen_95_part_10